KTPCPGRQGPKSKGNQQTGGGPPVPRTTSARGLDVRSLLSFRALRDFKLDLLSLFERLEAAHLDRGEVREQILTTVIRSYKAITLGIIEPLHRTCWHRAFLNFLTGNFSQLCLYFNAAEGFEPADRM